MITLFVAVPLLAILILNVLPKKLADGLSLWCGVALSAILGVYILRTPQTEWNTGFDPAKLALNWEVVPSNLAAVMFLSIALVVLCAFCVGQYLFTDKNRQFIFNNLLLLCMLGMNGLVFSQDLFTLYVFLEIVAGSSFVMIALEKSKDGLEGAFKYVLLSAIATVLILSSIALIFMVSGSLNYADVSTVLTSGELSPEASTLALLAIGLFAVGLFIKGGVVPFHGWLPDAYSSAPTAVSVLLGGIVTKAAGIFTLIQVGRNVFGFDQPSAVLLIIGTISIAFGAFAALGQKNFKRMLAYSSISQIGYIVIGLGAANPIALVGAILHLFNHSVFKTLLFVNAASVEKETGTNDMDELGGLQGKMPWTGFTSILAFLSTAGVPPLSGFWSKLFIVIGVWQAGSKTIAVLALLLSLMTAAYFLSMQRRVFFGKLKAGLEGVKEANMWALIPSIMLAAITLVLGVTLPWLFKTFLVSIERML